MTDTLAVDFFDLGSDTLSTPSDVEETLTLFDAGGGIGSEGSDELDEEDQDGLSFLNSTSPDVFGFDPSPYLIDVPDYLERHSVRPDIPDAALFAKDKLAACEGMGWLNSCDVQLVSPVSDSLEDQLRQLHQFTRVLLGEAVICPAALFPRHPDYVPSPLLSMDTETTGLDQRVRYDHEGCLTTRTKLVGVTVAAKVDRGYYLPVRHTGEDGVRNWIPEAITRWIGFLHTKFVCVYHNAAYDLEILALNGVTQFRNFPYLIDTQICDYLFNVNEKRHNLKDCSERYLKRKMIKIEELFKAEEPLGSEKDPVKKKKRRAKGNIMFEYLSASQALVYGASDSMNTYGLFMFYANQPANVNIFTAQPIPMSIDQRLLHTIRSMCRPGLPINIAYFFFAAKDAIHRLHILEQEIYRLIGSKINIGSQPQLNRVLFDQFKIPILPDHVRGKPRTVKSTGEVKPGLYSTDEKHLLKLHEKYPDHKILSYIITYRGLAGNIAKVYLKAISNSYVDALLPWARVNLGFNQTNVPTGRLSSSSSDSKERVAVTRTPTGAFTMRYDRGPWQAGFNSQGLPSDPLQTAPLRRIAKLPPGAGIDPQKPYSDVVERTFIEGIASI